jgi:hypothetical protein
MIRRKPSGNLRTLDTKFLTASGVSPQTGRARAPTAAFSADATSGAAPFEVQFTDLSTENPSVWEWGFDHDGTSTDQSAVYTYSANGTYTATLTARSASGAGGEKLNNFASVHPRPHEGEAGSRPRAVSTGKKLTLGAPVLIRWGLGPTRRSPLAVAVSDHRETHG